LYTLLFMKVSMQANWSRLNESFRCTPLVSGQDWEDPGGQWSVFCWSVSGIL
jgi:hypothetical protein